MSGAGTVNPGREQERQWASRALDRWASFPADQEPRPLVLVGPAANPEGGFRSGPAKLAFHYGHIEPAVPLPPGLLEVLGAGETRQAGQGPRHDRGTLLITSAAKDQAVFVTDRGRRSLPACLAANRPGPRGPAVGTRPGDRSYPLDAAGRRPTTAIPRSAAPSRTRHHGRR
jgi:hypothetical protein